MTARGLTTHRQLQATRASYTCASVFVCRRPCICAARSPPPLANPTAADLGSDADGNPDADAEHASVTRELLLLCAPLPARAAAEDASDTDGALGALAPVAPAAAAPPAAC